jgi:pimeloyl-ACP methyl ester carboxylesterase
MKLALLLPGYLESPDYGHLVVIDNHLQTLGYTTVRVDACHLWSTGDELGYTVTNYLHQVEEIIKSFAPQHPTETILIGHSVGGSVAVLAGSKFTEISKIICLNATIYFDKSNNKWINGIRCSKKDLPDNPSLFREFYIPISYVEDRQQYSVIDALKKIKQPLMILAGEADPSISIIEAIVSDLNIRHFVKIAGMGHDFRQSEELCHQVAIEIEKFLNQ